MKMAVTEANNCWKFTSYNREPFYGLGTKAQALTYLTILNRAKTINLVEVEPTYKDASFLGAVAIDLLSEIRDQGDKEEDLESLQGIRGEMSNFTQALDDIIQAMDERGVDNDL